MRTEALRENPGGAAVGADLGGSKILVKWRNHYVVY